MISSAQICKYKYFSLYFTMYNVWFRLIFRKQNVILYYIITLKLFDKQIVTIFRWLYMDFFNRYRVLCRSTDIKRENPKLTCERILSNVIKVSYLKISMWFIKVVFSFTNKVYKYYVCNYWNKVYNFIIYLIHCA